MTKLDFMEVYFPLWGSVIVPSDQLISVKAAARSQFYGATRRDLTVNWLYNP